MEKYCFGGETEAVVTSYHTSLPGVREARLETSETPLPLTARTLRSVLQAESQGQASLPYILNKTDREMFRGNNKNLRVIFPLQFGEENYFDSRFFPTWNGWILLIGGGAKLHNWLIL